MNTTFKKLRNIGDSEPKPWNSSSSSTGIKFTTNEDCEDDDLPAPYCNDSDEDLYSEQDESEEIDEEIENETETETESISSKKKRVIFLQEETDFMQE